MSSILDEMIDRITPEIYQNMKQAIETGKWPDGRVLSAEQRETTLQAVILWGEKHLPPNERVGFVQQKEHTHCETDQPDVEGPAADEARPLKWQD